MTPDDPNRPDDEDLKFEEDPFADEQVSGGADPDRLSEAELESLLAAAESELDMTPDPADESDSAESVEEEATADADLPDRESDMDLLVAQAAREDDAPSDGTVANDSAPEDILEAEAESLGVPEPEDSLEGISFNVDDEVSDAEFEAALDELEQSETESLVANETNDETPAPEIADAEMDEPLGSENVEVAEEAPDEVGEAPEEIDETPDEIDQAPDELGQAPDESLVVGSDADEPLVDSDMDDRLDSPVEIIAEDQDEESISLEPPEPETEAPAELSLIEIDEEESSPEETAVEAAAEIEEEAPATVLERVASENLAAGAPENTAALEPETPTTTPGTESAPEPELPEPSTTEAAAQVPVEAAPSREFTPPDLLSALKRSPLRTLSSLAAGIVLALGAFVLLYLNQFRPAADLATFPIRDAAGLERVMLQARELMDAGNPAKAQEMLADALTRTPPAVAGLDDARYLRLEARFQALPDTLAIAEANRVHEEIDDLTDATRAHPRAAEALYWKAKVYQRQDNAIAARAELRGIMDNFGDAAILDRVFLALAESLLDAERPMDAVTHLQRLIQDYPSSPFASRARLLMGDAYAAAGQPDNARIVYIRLAENQANRSIGTLAYQRIGELAVETGDYRSAIRELESRLETATTVEGNDRIYLLLAKAYRAADRLQDARDILTELIDFFPESTVTPNAYIELSQVLNDMGLDREALRMASQTVQQYPDTVAVLDNAAALFRSSGDSLRAAEALIAAHKAGAKQPQVLLSAGQLFREADATTEASDAFETLLTLYPTSPEAVEGNIEWAEILFEQGHVQEAFGRLNDMALATEGHPRRLTILNATAEMYADLGLTAEVVKTYSQIAGLTEEPEMLARAATALIREGAPDAGMQIARRVSVDHLDARVAYDFLMAQGEVWLRGDPDEAIAVMEQAHAAYADQRTNEGIQRLLEANLTRGQTARARALVAELQQRVARPENAEERPWLDRAAVTWGDHLYQRRDYRGASDAYAIVLDAIAEPSTAPPTDAQAWSMYQGGNALVRLERFAESLELFEKVASTGSEWADDATAKAESVRLELRLRGDSSDEAGAE